MSPPSTPGLTPLDRAVRAERTMVRVRWVGVAFAAVQVATYYLPYPPGVLPVAAWIVAVLAMGNLGVALALRRARDLSYVRTVEIASLVLDAAVVMGLVFVFTFDPDTAMWAVIYILPLEGAIKFGLRGALLTMGAATIAYTVRELYGEAVYETPFLATSVSFRMGIGFIIAGVAGAMASSLGRDRERLERAKAAVEASAEELASVVEQLKAATAVKDEFIAVTNHELRTPLTTIMGYAQTLETRWSSFDDAQRLEFIGHIRHQGRRLHLLVEDLLTLSSAQAGALDLDLTPVALLPAIDEAIGQNGLAAAGVGVRCPAGLRVMASEDRLVQILTNLISNALKYGAEPVEVVAHLDGDWVDVAVCDSGEGVPPGFVPRLFDRFSQASHGASRTAAGTGLGLAIVQELVVAQGGEVRYEPNEPTGARFCVRLRAAPQTTPPG
jgi:signal transduction histidine kinase